MTKESLQHIAFIMDGNRRWARKHAMPIALGHKKGAETLTDIAKAVKECGVRYMTVYAFSTENWKRDKAEVDALMSLLRQYLDNSFKQLEENNVKIKFIGERAMLASDIIEKMVNIENNTAQNSEMTLCIALSYGSRQEIVAAMQKIAQSAVKGTIRPEDITSDTIARSLYTADIPDPDLLIRTSGEMRLSNYLLWQLAYTELYFSDTLWPDFSKKELEDIIANYETRERRYGKS